jgi:hypothetical protein
MGFHFESADAHASFCKDISTRRLELIKPDGRFDIRPAGPAVPSYQAMAAGKKDSAPERRVDCLIPDRPRLSPAVYDRSFIAPTRETLSSSRLPPI